MFCVINIVCFNKASTPEDFTLIEVDNTEVGVRLPETDESTSTISIIDDSNIDEIDILFSESTDSDSSDGSFIGNIDQSIHLCKYATCCFHS